MTPVGAVSFSQSRPAWAVQARIQEVSPRRGTPTVAVGFVRRHANELTERYLFYGNELHPNDWVRSLFLCDTGNGATPARRMT